MLHRAIVERWIKDWNITTYSRGSPYRATGKETVLPIRYKNDSGVMVIDDTHITVCVFGSVDIADWWMNLRMILGPDNDERDEHNEHTSGLIDSMFTNAGSLIRNRVVRLIGHSRGGGLVVRMALKLKMMGVTVGDVVTFGAPPSGRHAFCVAYEQYGLPHTRIVIPGDPVPKVDRVWGRHTNHTPVVLPTCHGSIKKKHLSYGAQLLTLLSKVP